MKSTLPSLSLRVAAVVAAGLFFTSLTGCVSNDEYKRLNSAFVEARNQLAAAENDVQRARARIAELEGRIADLDKLNGGQGLDALRQERDLLSQQLADLQKKYNDLLATADQGPQLPVAVNDALRDLAAKYPDLLDFDERLGMLRLKSDLTFDVGSTDVKPGARKALAEVAKIFDMPEIAHNEIQVMGHTDDIPVRASNTMRMNPSNEILSTNRAWAVAAVLHADGVHDNRLLASGWGEQRPIVANAPGHRGNEKNRRVDIYVRPTTVPDGIVISTPGSAAPARPAPAANRAKPPAKPAAAPAGASASPSGVPLPR